MKIDLHWKLTFIFCLSAVLGLLIGYAYLSGQLNAHLEKDLESNLKKEILLAKDFLESQKHDLDLPRADQIADKIGHDLGARATIIDAQGKVLGDSELTLMQVQNVENHFGRPEVQQAAAQGLGLSKRYSYTIKKYLLYMAIPFNREEAQGFLRLAIPIAEINLLEGRIDKIIGGALLLVFALSLAFVSLTAWFVSRPLREIATVARSMAQGDFSRKPSVRSQDEIGELARALMYMSDEIEKKIEKIQQESVKLDAVLSSMVEGIMVVNEKGRIVLLNPSLKKIFLVDTEPDGKMPLEVIANAKVQSIVDQALHSHARWVSEEVVVSHPMEKILQANAVPIVRSGHMEGAVIVFHDITELRRLEKIRQDFVANVSHELRTPISSIKGYAETLLDGAIHEQEHARDFLNIIYQDSNRLASLISDLLDLSKIESGKMKMDLSPTDLKPIFERCLGVLKKTIEIKSLSISLDAPDQLPKVLGDDRRLAQVVLNLLDNAIKYTPESGSVKIKIYSSGSHVQADITDNGIGIPEQDIPRIFERFYRVDKSHSRELGGTGLGLSIAKHIVLAHQGQIWVRSDFGQGSTFSFTVPQA